MEMHGKIKNLLDLSEHIDMDKTIASFYPLISFHNTCDAQPLLNHLDEAQSNFRDLF